MKWNTMEDAPKNGSPVLLWAKLKSNPAEANDFYPIVGFWHRSVERWKVSPENLNQQEDLEARFWTALPEPPTINEEIVK